MDNVDIQFFINFLKKAHKNTYAADGKKIISSRLCSEDLEFNENDWLYHDTYFGNENFIYEP